MRSNVRKMSPPKMDNQWLFIYHILALGDTIFLPLECIIQPWSGLRYDTVLSRLYMLRIRFYQVHIFWIRFYQVYVFRIRFYQVYMFRIRFYQVYVFRIRFYQVYMFRIRFYRSWYGVIKFIWFRKRFYQVYMFRIRFYQLRLAKSDIFTPRLQNWQETVDTYIREQEDDNYRLIFIFL